MKNRLFSGFYRFLAFLLVKIVHNVLNTNRKKGIAVKMMGLRSLYDKRFWRYEKSSFWRLFGVFTENAS